MPTPNCQQLNEKLQELSDLKEVFSIELERVKKDGKAGRIYEIKKQIEEIQSYLNEELKEFFFTVIEAKTPESKEITFNFETLLNESKQLYNELDLTQWSQELPETIVLTEEQIQNIKEKVEKHGFNRMQIFPSTETQNRSLEKLAQESTASIDGLKDSEQYAQEGIYLYESVKEAFPDNITTKNRPEGCYIQLYKDDPEVPDDTKNKTYPQARQEQKENGLVGYTLAEYLIFQRKFTKEFTKHPEYTNYTWCTDSEIGVVVSPRVLRAGWNPGDRGLRCFPMFLSFTVAFWGFAPRPLFPLSFSPLVFVWCFGLCHPKGDQLSAEFLKI